MKKLILGLTILLLLGCGNCNDSGKYRVIYRVYWPGNPKTYRVIMNDKPYLGSDRGTNYLKEGGINSTENIIRTSAPIEIVRYEKII